MAVVAMIVGLVSGPVTFCLTLFGDRRKPAGRPSWW